MKTRRLSARALVIALALSLLPSLGHGAPGALDKTFSGDGKVTHSVGATDYGRAIAIQGNGKIVMTGIAHNGTDFDVALIRLRPNGAMDTDFATGGIATLDINDDDQAMDVILQPNGGILIAGYASNGATLDTFVVRYDGTGERDMAFAGDGMWESTAQRAGVHDIGEALALQPDGKILVAGYTTNGDRDMTVVRLTSQGQLDSTFDDDGYRDIDFVEPGGAGSTEDASAVSVMKDGRIVISGTMTHGPSVDGDFAVARLETDGDLDPTFDLDGRQTADFGSDDVAHAGALQPDGRVVVVGRTYGGTDSGTDTAVARFRANGAPDSSFGSGGKVTTSFAGVDQGNDVAVQDDGRLVVGGDAHTGNVAGNSQLAVLRFLPGGALDRRFSSDGRALVEGGIYEDYAEDIAVVGGRIVAAGTADLMLRDFFLTRLLGRSGRRVTLAARPRSPERGRRFRLVGEVISGDERCEVRQVVKILRDPAGAPRRFRLVAKRRTNFDGEFRLRQRARTEARYRAMLAPSDSCGRTSKTISVSLG